MIIVTTSSGRHWQSNTNSIGPRSLPAAGQYPRLCWWHHLLAWGRRGHSLGPLPGWVLGFGQRQGLFQGVGLCGAPPARPVRVPWDQVAWALSAVAVLGCGAQFRRSTRKLWLYLYFFRVFFCFFGSKLTPPGALEKARLCTGGCCPASPSTRGSEQRCCSGEGTVGRRWTSAPLPSQIPLLELEIWGIGPCAAPLPRAIPWGIGAEAWT